MVCLNHVGPGVPGVLGVMCIYLLINLSCHTRISDVCAMNCVLSQNSSAMNRKVNKRSIHVLQVFFHYTQLAESHGQIVYE